MLLNLPLSRSKLDRAAHLRADQAAIDELWSRAKVIEMLGDKFKVTSSGLNFQSSKDVEGERYFLGLSENSLSRTQPRHYAVRSSEEVGVTVPLRKPALRSTCDFIIANVLDEMIAKVERRTFGGINTKQPPINNFCLN